LAMPLPAVLSGAFLASAIAVTVINLQLDSRVLASLSLGFVVIALAAALAYTYHSIVQIEVGDVEPDEFGQPQPREGNAA
jgi:hypothetical protein